MKIYLIGYMSSGKSTLGKTLAHRLGYKFIDIDQLFEESYKISINDFFERFGEDKFREIEHQLLLNIKEEDNVIISTGGGTPCFFNNMELINNNGISIYLKLHYKSIIDRLRTSKKKRPLVKDLNNEEFEQYIEKHLSEREKYYTMAHHTIKSENLNVTNLYQFLIDNKICN